MVISVPQQRDIELNRVYRRFEFAERAPKWSSPIPGIEVVGEGTVSIYASNLPRHTVNSIYESPIESTLADIQAKMTLMTNSKGTPLEFSEGFHDACMCTVWIAFVWNNDSAQAPTVRDSCLIDWELVARQDAVC